MRKTSSPADRHFVVDLPDAIHQFAIERRLANHDALLFGQPRPIAGFVVDLLPPPLVECRDMYGGTVVPFHRIPVFRRGIGYALGKREEVGASARLPECRERLLGPVVQEQVGLRFQTSDAQYPALNPKIPGAYVHPLSSPSHLPATYDTPSRKCQKPAGVIAQFD